MLGTLCVVVFTFVILINNPCDPSITMIISTTLIVAAQIVEPTRAFSGFASEGVMSIAILFVIAASISETGSLDLLIRYILRKPRGLFCALFRLCVPIALSSAFINNTPVVAMMIPGTFSMSPMICSLMITTLVVEQWSQKIKISPSKLMIPLSYSTIIGGTCTMIGTSTNLVVRSLANAQDPTISFPFFEIGIVGGPILVVGLVYILFVTHWLLPDRRSPLNDFFEDSKSYIVGAVIHPGSHLIGKTLEDSGLLHLKGLRLFEIQRQGQVINAGDHIEALMEEDSLLFTATKVSALWNIKGLAPYDHNRDIITPDIGKIIVEATVGPRSRNLLNRKIRKVDFRTTYHASILSVYRNGEPLHETITEIKLQGGDMLLMVTKNSFIEKHQYPTRTADFVLVNQVGREPLRRDWLRLIWAPLCGIVMVVLNAAEVTDLLTAALSALVAIIVTKCISFRAIKTAVNVPVIVTIAASFAMADALNSTGVAKELAANLITITKWSGDWGLLYGIYLATALLTALLSNASAAAILVPVVFGLVENGATIPIKAFLYVIMVGASADFSTPIGYQTNLMVWGPGGYRFLDYTRVGLPLQLILSVVSVSVIHLVWVA